MNKVTKQKIVEIILSTIILLVQLIETILLLVGAICLPNAIESSFGAVVLVITMWLGFVISFLFFVGLIIVFIRNWKGYTITITGED